jgi:hypothetical protein
VTVRHLPAARGCAAPGRSARLRAPTAQGRWRITLAPQQCGCWWCSPRLQRAEAGSQEHRLRRFAAQVLHEVRGRLGLAARWATAAVRRIGSWPVSTSTYLARGAAAESASV